jgi:hypothetical protein
MTAKASLLASLRDAFDEGADLLSSLVEDSDLAALGECNLRWLADNLAHRQRALSNRLGRLKEASYGFTATASRLLEHAGPKGVDAIVSEPVGNFELFPEPAGPGQQPSVETLRNLKRGDTTLRACGWCEYAGEGVYRDGAMLSGGCQALQVAGFGDVVALFNSPCLLLAALPAQRRLWQAGAARTSRDCSRQYAVLETLVDELTALAKASKDRPWLPLWRPKDAFALGEPVIVWLRRMSPSEAVVGPTFALGCVVRGSEPSEGSVCVELQQPNQAQGQEKALFVLPVQSASVLRRREFEGLRTCMGVRNRDDRRFGALWLLGSGLTAAQQDSFVEDLKQPTF